jgi:hypothetical protein
VPFAAGRAEKSHRLLTVNRVFNIDIETCQACGGAVRIIA